MLSKFEIILFVLSVVIAMISNTLVNPHSALIIVAINAVFLLFAAIILLDLPRISAPSNRRAKHPTVC